MHECLYKQIQPTRRPPIRPPRLDDLWRQSLPNQPTSVSEPMNKFVTPLSTYNPIYIPISNPLPLIPNLPPSPPTPTRGRPRRAYGRLTALGGRQPVPRALYSPILTSRSSSSSSSSSSPPASSSTTTSSSSSPSSLNGQPPLPISFFLQTTSSSTIAHPPPPPPPFRLPSLMPPTTSSHTPCLPPAARFSWVLII
ncbi:uncharacterized protein LOC135216555 [Macrobrachium nipponense]|uniref:uncharacterized protein LOC135216555 n=1 Tax=Macrobrachium nipponense TaxID=159736 RepID=UPI0030C8CCEE